MSEQPAASMAPDYEVADLGLADWGRKEIAIAENEMRLESRDASPQRNRPSGVSWAGAPRGTGRHGGVNRTRLPSIVRYRLP